MIKEENDVIEFVELNVGTRTAIEVLQDPPKLSKPHQQITLEQQIFVWENWDENGPLCPQFYNVELIVPVGEFPAGTKFPVAFFNGDKSTLSLMDEDDVEHVYEMFLTIGNKLDSAESKNYISRDNTTDNEEPEDDDQA